MPEWSKTKNKTVTGGTQCQSHTQKLTQLSLICCSLSVVGRVDRYTCHCMQCTVTGELTPNKYHSRRPCSHWQFAKDCRRTGTRVLLCVLVCEHLAIHLASVSTQIRVQLDRTHARENRSEPVHKRFGTFRVCEPLRDITSPTHCRLT